MKYHLHSISLSVLILFALTANSQIYKPVNPQSAAIYTTWPDKGRTSSLTVIDSVQVENNIEFNLYKKWNIGFEPAFGFELVPDEDCENDSWGSGGFCAPANIPLWLGPKIVQLDSNLYELFTSNGDTLRFNFDLNQGDSTLVYTDGQESYYMIYETSELDNFINYSDSVAKYRMAHVDQSGSVVNSSIQNAPIVIGKDLGIVNFFRIDSFPDLLQPIQIAGHLETQSGLYKIKADAIFDFEVGDLFQYKYVQSEYAPNTAFTKYIEKTVLERNETDTSITYVFGVDAVKLQSFSEFIDGTFVSTVDTSFSSETIEEVVSKSEIIAELPLHLHSSDIPYLFQDVNFLDTTDYGAEWQYISRSSFLYKCYSDSIACYVNPQNLSENPSIPIYGPTVYEQGLGITSSYNGWHSNFANNTVSIKLIYYEKNGDSFGNEWVLSTENNLVRRELKIWPNPAKEFVQISLPKPMQRIDQLELYDVQGKLMYQSKPKKIGIFRMELQDMVPGLYLLKAKSGSIIYTQKFILE